MLTHPERPSTDQVIVQGNFILEKPMFGVNLPRDHKDLNNNQGQDIGVGQSLLGSTVTANPTATLSLYC